MFLTVHHSIDSFHLPTLMHNSLFINNMYKLEHWYVRHNNVYCFTSVGYMFQPIHRSSSGPEDEDDLCIG